LYRKPVSFRAVNGHQPAAQPQDQAKLKERLESGA
jgi:hypothetical protein